MLLFKGKSIDAHYEYEYLFYKFIIGNGFKNNQYGECWIYYDRKWIEVDRFTVEIIKED